MQLLGKLMKRWNRGGGVADDIGPRIECIRCRQSFYYFQYNDHLQVCLERPQKQDEQPKRKQLVDQMEPKKPKKPKESNESKKPDEPDEPDEPEEPKEPDGPKGEEQNREDRWLEKQQEREDQSEAEVERQLIKFEESRQKASRIADNSSNLGRMNLSSQKGIKMAEMKQLIEEIPCPFCCKLLTLQELLHVDKCSESAQCQICHDKYPKELIQPHQKLCSKNKKQLVIPESQLKSIINPPMKFGINDPPQSRIQKKWNSSWEVSEREQCNLGVILSPQSKVRPEVREMERSRQSQREREYDLRQSQREREREYNLRQRQSQRDREYNLRQRQRQSQRDREYDLRQSQRERKYDPRELDQQSRLHSHKLKGMSSGQVSTIDWQLFIPSSNNTSSQTKQCSICSAEYEIAEAVITLECAHMFHKECLATWLKQRATCPVCRVGVRV